MNKQQAQARAAVASGRARHRAALAADAHLIPTIRQLRKEGVSFGKIATHLNDLGHQTRQGKRFQAASVFTILRRARR
jgi:hypothetical protein